jgi:hypothetical protein
MNTQMVDVNGVLGLPLIMTGMLLLLAFDMLWRTMTSSGNAWYNYANITSLRCIFGSTGKWLLVPILRLAVFFLL